MTVLRGDRVVLRPATASDVPALYEALTSPGTAERWPLESIADVEKMLADDDVAVFAVEVEGAVVGVIQHYEERDPEYRHAGIDIALHSEWCGQGAGTDAVRTMVRHLLADLGHHRVVIDPAADNTRAIRCYEKVGFKPVGVMRQYERGPDGSFHDGLLMDLVADDVPHLLP